MAPRASKRGKLSREEIVHAALALAEHGDSDDVSLHKVAASLGVRAMSLYRYVTDKSDLLDAMGDAVLDQVSLPDLTGLDWRQALRALAVEFHRALTRYPQSAPLVLTRRLNAPAAMPLVNAALGQLRDAGLNTDEAVRALRVFIAFLIGSLIREVGLPNSHADPSQGGLPSLAAGGYPHIEACALDLETIDHHREFHHGLDLFLTSLSARVSQLDDAGR